MPVSPPFLIITGLAGAGRSSALKALEDNGFTTIDNLPFTLLADYVRTPQTAPIAIGLDSRTQGFDTGAVLGLMRAHPAIQLLFLTASIDVLTRRFSATRRRHPLARKGENLADAIAREQVLLAPLQSAAHVSLDTSNLTPTELAAWLGKQVPLGGQLDAPMEIRVMSFSYQHGLPAEADLVFDARFLRNPFYVPELASLSGRDSAVQDYVVADPDFEPFIKHVQALLHPLLQRFAREGKKYLTVAVGCTGGRHRSVTVVERLATWLLTDNKARSINHRELDRANSKDISL